MDETRSQSFSLKGQMLEQLRAAALRRGESMSFIVREALRQYFEREHTLKPDAEERRDRPMR